MAEKLVLSYPGLIFLCFLFLTVGASSLEPTVSEEPIVQEKQDSFKIKFDRFNKKAEKFFTYVPAPIVSSSPETGYVYGLAKLNIIELYPADTGTTPTNIHGLVSFSSLGHTNFYAGTQVYLRADSYFMQGGIGYRYFPEYIQGIGNQPFLRDVESFVLRQVYTNNVFYKGLYQNNFLGFVCNVNNVLGITLPKDSYLDIENITGKDGGLSVGFGLSYLYDKRDNRYNSSSGHYFNLEMTFHQHWFGSDFNYNHYVIDLREYRLIYRHQVLAFQLYTEANLGDVPFFSLAKLGGSNRMRGYYEGAIRDKIILDSQVEYRVPIWNIFGMTAWVGTGRVAESYESLEAADFWFSYGFGLRFMIDSKNKTNLRLEFGFGEEGYQALNVNFSEAF
ncbi:BamA/TamA family outer membrane protein [candidate division CSSED10-310 bacterium]|uniref:BamA/TamA family outer membrane protein n=1 Tax=candidate division CSSED10-310 bacterium TaxID=2855610 RepID=A0ABV6YX05_UNCC1